MKLGSFDIIGNIAVLPLYTKNPGRIAKQLMAENKNIKTVYMKSGKIKGRLRKLQLKFIAGIKTKETIHRESGCLLKFDVEKCYFSPRMSNDRIEVAKQVKPGEKVLVMFSGIGPYGIVIAKNTKAKEVVMVELNRIAHKYALENIRMNKLTNITAIQGDVKKIIPKLGKKIKFDMSEINGKISEHAQKPMVFDRIVMARPQLKEDFLEEALKVSKEGTIIHFYDFILENEMPGAALKKISMAVEKFSKKPGIRIESYKLIRWAKALEIGPRKWRVRVDFYVF